MINAVSFSRRKEFRECLLKGKLKFVDKIPDPRPPLPEGKEHPMDRGKRVHELAEQVVRDGWEEGGLPEELEKFEPRLELVRELYLVGKADLEVPIAMDRNWDRSDPRDFQNTVYRMVADVMMEHEDQCIVIDYKTGRKDGNEVTHTQQGMDYLAAVYMTHPDFQRFSFEAWYLDAGDILPTVSFTRAEMQAVVRDFKKAYEDLLAAQFFPPSPSMSACLYCPYKKGTVGRGRFAYAGTGHCDKNVN
jgi:hypothetical protein